MPPSNTVPPPDPAYIGRSSMAPVPIAQTITIMPLPGSASAPRTFDGNEEEIADFLEHFLHCAQVAQLSEADCVTFFFRYLSKDQKDFFRGLDGFKEKDWETFEAAIKQEFKEAFEDGTHTKRKLLTLIGNTAKSLIQTAQQLCEYYQKFQGIAKVLVKEENVSEKDSAGYFWCGLHDQTKAKLLPKLEARLPNQPIDQPYAITDIVKIGVDVFADTAWYKNLPTDAPTQNRQMTDNRETEVTT